MPDLIDRRNLSFVLYELEEIEHLTRYPRFAEHSRETFEAAIDTAHAIAVDKFAPHNRKGDLEEPRLVDGRVEMIPEVREALQAYSESGFTAMELDFEAGGMQLPGPVALACSSLFQIANIATTAYAGLSHGVAAMLAAHGSEEQKRRYMDPINEGRFFGTMCLSEPHAGSSLADIRTRAEPADGHYLLTGSKMWISGGDHELAENIIEMVLAKIPGGPPGVKGISLFIVPKYLVNEDGTLGERNDIQLAGLNHKMGYRGTTNTFLKLGERGHCVGYLVGEPHKGLSYMFHMMNGARIGVGMGATALGYAGYLHSLEYARERPQGRHPDQKDPAAPPVPIIGHADVRRMLLQQKCYVEGAYALAMYCSSLELRGRHEEDAATRGEAGLLLDVLTPVMKAWPSAWCLKANELAIQVLGGYGYTRDYPVEQYYRDNRLNPIHEGTNGIQALDLLGRKMQMQGGAGLSLLSREMQATIDAALAEPALQEHAKALAGALEALRRTTGGIRATLASGQVRAGLANAHAYLEMAGHIIIAWMWLRQALVAARAVDAARGADESFYRGKLQACRFFFRHELPIVHTHAALIDSGDRTTLDMAPEWF